MYTFPPQFQLAQVLNPGPEEPRRSCVKRSENARMFSRTFMTYQNAHTWELGITFMLHETQMMTDSFMYSIFMTP